MLLLNTQHNLFSCITQKINPKGKHLFNQLTQPIKGLELKLKINSRNPKNSLRYNHITGKILIELPIIGISCIII
jgi:hypothetical protein